LKEIHKPSLEIIMRFYPQFHSDQTVMMMILVFLPTLSTWVTLCCIIQVMEVMALSTVAPYPLPSTILGRFDASCVLTPSPFIS
jgi:hypothetical protein